MAANPGSGAGKGIFGIIALGIVLVLLGVPFVGMTVMIFSLVSRNPLRGLPVAVGALFVTFLITDFTGALIAATGAGVASLLILKGRNLRYAAAAASAATAIAAMMSAVLLTQQSIVSRENMESLTHLYSSAGMSSSDIMTVMNLLIYVLPSIMAIWAASGVITSVVAARLVGKKRGTWPRVLLGARIQLGLPCAWILIAALAVNLLGSSLPESARQAAVNVSIFMFLPYSLVGLAVWRALVSLYPHLLLFAVFAGIVFPPVALGLLFVTGVLDTWFDFRKGIAQHMERKKNK